MSAFRMFGGDPSVMASGDWYKITVDRDGIYRITCSELISLGITDPANVRIYGSGGAMLSEKANEHSGDDLQEIPIWMYTGNDGVFNNGDYILFYGQGPAIWQYNKEKQAFEHSIHLWDHQSCYFITSKAGGKRISAETPPSAPPSQTVTSFDERQYYEAEQVSLIKSGRYWYGEDFRSVTTYRFPFAIPDIETGEAAKMNISFMAQVSSSAAHLAVTCNGRQVADQPLPVSADYQIATATTFNTVAFNPASGNLSVELTMNRNGVSNSGGWLDYIRLFARRKLNMASSQLFFRDTQSVGAGRTSRFRITGSNANTQVWDITDKHNIRRMDASLSGSALSFSATTDALREFVAFDIASGLLKPAFPEKNAKTENQNLHGIENVDMIIVTHPDFMDAALELAALHYNRDGMTVEVVTAEQVYNEFSSGMQDPAAIRNFMKHLYGKPAAVKLKYLLLMGDGSYDNKSNQIKEGRAAANTNYIVTYQSENSWHSTDSFVSDDYFGILGDNEDIETGKLAIGTGRIPVQTADQAREAVDKIRRYIDAKLSGDWPNLMGLLADDEDGNLHAMQSETLANDVATHHPQYTVEKLYFDAFSQTATVDGHRYPEVEQRLNDLLNRGCLLVNYIGHGNESGLSAERVVNTTNIEQWTNRLYPLFVVATCEFGRYDNDTKVTAGESVLLHPAGGGIAVLTSARLVYSSLNFEFNRSFFHELLHRSDNGDDHRLGDVLRRAKNASGSSVNKLCFTLLGDPALKPVIPADSVRTVSINGKLVSEPLDTLKANSNVTVKGCITGTNGRVLTGFNGTVHFSLFDKPHENETLNNDGDAVPMSFHTRTSALYKGKAAVKNGEFEISFIMPRDINYRYGFGKISYYAYSDHGEAAAGAFEEIIVGGFAPGTDDTEGPKIQLFMNDTQFRDGGITDQNPKLIACLQDEHGINISDEGIGHNITAILNNDPSIAYILNPYYEADLGRYNRGVVNYRFTNLSAGNYELLFTAWDLENNSSQARIRFRVTKSSILQIDKLYNYPNPFTDNTRIYFEFNMPETELQVELQVYSMSGRLLRSMKQSLYSDGYTSGNFEWDGRDAGNNHMRPGIYPYRVILRTEKGQMVWQASKMVIGN
ncbi:MAG: type IX secretion system sortase PorU [Bacteroidales bacterium]|nr:type IX secretion system sortase PorU [Bacteroidales bacterium]